MVGAGADELIAICAGTFLAPGRRAAIFPPTYGLYRIASQLEGAEVVTEPKGADLIWVCNPNNPTGELRDPADDRRARARAPAGGRRRRRGVLGVRRRHVRPARRRAAEPDRAADALEGVRLRGAASRLRGRGCGDRGRARAAAAAGERLGAGGTDRGGGAAGAAPRHRRDRGRARARAQVPHRRRVRLPRDARQLRLGALGGHARASASRRQGSSSGSSPRESGSRCGGHPRTTSCSKRSARPAGRRPGERRSSRGRAARRRSRSCSISTASAARASRPESAFSITC